MVTLLENYSGLKKGDTFRILDTGSDWVRISAGGKALYVPMNLAKD